jgi:hypothetical protein
MSNLRIQAKLKLTNPRADRIDAAVASAGELIGTLMSKGPVNPEQAGLIVRAAVRAVVPNFEEFEIRDSANRIVAEVEKLGGSK